MLKQSMKHKQGQQGFTLLEILVVVAIMGFLVAMVAPRFAGIVGSTEDIVCDSNQQRLVAALSAYNESTGRYPSHMVNLVDRDTSVDDAIGGYRVPTTERSVDTDIAPATFSEAFDEHHWFQIHILNADEARELRNLGVRTVYNLNAYNYRGLPTAATTYPTEAYREDKNSNLGDAEMDLVDEANQGDFMEQVEVAGGLGVLMVGMGAINTTAEIDRVAGLDGRGTDESEADHLGRFDTIGRIVLGVGPENSLIREGMITTAGLCPADLSDDLFTWNNYSLILPRLEETVERFADVLELDSISARSGEGIVRNRIDVTSTESWSFATACPEGHSWPETEEFDAWMIQLADEWT